MKTLNKMVFGTDCGEVTVQTFEDEIAKGVKVCLNGEIVAILDCYNKENLPSTYSFPKEEFDFDDIEEELLDALSNKFGYCIKTFKFIVGDTDIVCHHIEWEEDMPEARVLVYEADEDEPSVCLTVN